MRILFFSLLLIIGIVLLWPSIQLFIAWCKTKYRKVFDPVKEETDKLNNKEKS